MMSVVAEHVSRGTPATIHQLSSIVPAAMPNRDGFILGCLAVGVSVSEVHARMDRHRDMCRRFERPAQRRDWEQISADVQRIQAYPTLLAYGGTATGLTGEALVKWAANSRPDLYAAHSDLKSVANQERMAAVCRDFTAYMPLVAHLQTHAGGGMTKAMAIAWANAARPDLRSKYVGRAA